MSMVKGISHVAYLVSDMQKSLDFYCNKLKMEHAFSIPDDKGKPWIEYIRVCENQFIELFYANEGDYSSDNKSFMHLCLEVEDCVKTSQELEELGVDVYIKPNQGKDFNWQCWIKDPDGHQIEIMQLSPQSPQMKR